MRQIVLSGLMCLATSAAAATLGEEKRFVINPLGGTDFEVIRLQQMGPAELWCAAASYVEVRQGLSETTPIYVKTPIGPARTASRRQAVVFSLSNEGLPAPDPERLSVTVDVPGEMMKSAQARRFCRDAFTRSTK
ncbi:hypothetical protein ABMC89_06360 [Sulfitobacter sp. HNIBRBA3233]|uniref:hypothetical protein n=1 Tax=Sulfitobacter marinivivus TaxID=3158558 RepID=UPI0032DFD844